MTAKLHINKTQKQAAKKERKSKVEEIKRNSNPSNKEIKDLLIVIFEEIQATQ